MVRPRLWRKRYSVCVLVAAAALGHPSRVVVDGFCPRGHYRGSVALSPAAVQDDENSKEQSNNEEARLLEQQLRNFMQASSQQQQQQQGISANAEATDVEQVVQRLLNNNDSVQAASPFPRDSDEDDEDGIFLDPEVYARSRESLGPDGSLRLSNSYDNNSRSQSWEGQSSSFSTPASVAGVDPTRKAVMNDFLQSFSSQSGSSPPRTPTTQRQGQPDATMDDLLQAMKAQQLKLETNATTTLAEEEELHRRVLAEEEGFQQQSQLFRESLTDASKSAQVSELRHGQAFRRRQEAARQSLEAELAAFEAELAQRHVEHPCQKCGCELTEEEIQHATTGAPAVCRICLSEDIYRTSKLGDIKQTRVPNNNVMYPANYASSQSNARYASSKASARPVPRPPAAPQQPSVAASQRPASRIPATTQQQRPQRPDQSASTPYRERPSVEQGSSSARASALQQFIQEQQSQSSSTDKSSNQKEDATQNNDNQEWEEMEDPDTGETFFWNTRTNEMRY